MHTSIHKAINEQITAELAASYSYLAMSAYCDRQNFRGAARWLRIQSQEEYGHAMKLFDFVLARGGEIDLGALARPQTDYKSIAAVFETALAQEKEVGEQIDRLYELAFREKAFAALVELQWFLTEQVEEERTARELVAKFHMVKDDPASLLELDRELGSRQTVEAPPSAPAPSA